MSEFLESSNICHNYGSLCVGKVGVYHLRRIYIHIVWMLRDMLSFVLCLLVSAETLATSNQNFGHLIPMNHISYGDVQSHFIPRIGKLALLCQTKCGFIVKLELWSLKCTRERIWAWQPLSKDYGSLHCVLFSQYQ